MKPEVIREIAKRYRTGQGYRFAMHVMTNALKLLNEAGYVVVKTEELEAALRPFAKFADAHCDEHEKAMEVGGYVPLDDDYPIEVPFGTVRRAAALLAAITQEGRG